MKEDKMDNINKIRLISVALVIIFVIIIILVISGVSENEENNKNNFFLDEESYTSAEKEEYEDKNYHIVKGIIMAVNEDGSVHFHDTENKMELKLNIDSLTEYRGKSGKLKVLDSDACGELVVVKYGSNKNIISIVPRTDTWSYDNIKNYKIDRTKYLIEYDNIKYIYRNAYIINDNN
ncbi:MAG: hypothetical protein K6G26_10120, partial [Lachnospiraceae bacterium]|nr:hypothetical protein [Lachnospiraceae bacterium]